MMRSSWKWLLAVGVVALVVQPGLAQRGGPRPGGPGFMSPAMLLQNKGVQKELKLSDDQVQKVEAAVKEVWAKHKDEFKALSKLERQEQREKGAELMKTVSKETDKALAGVLKADQQKRLHQILLQAEGARAFQDPKVQQKLKLTDEQKESIKTIEDDARKEMQEIFQNARGNNDREAAGKKMAALRKETMEKVSGVLTDEQKTEWKQMTGKAFEIKFERRGNRPRGGGGAGGSRGERDKLGDPGCAGRAYVGGEHRRQR
jgi:Spy/CpxP family protein refolding chaperone